MKSTQANQRFQYYLPQIRLQFTSGLVMQALNSSSQPTNTQVVPYLHAVLIHFSFNNLDRCTVFHFVYLFTPGCSVGLHSVQPCLSFHFTTRTTSRLLFLAHCNHLGNPSSFHVVSVQQEYSQGNFTSGTIFNDLFQFILGQCVDNREFQIIPHCYIHRFILLCGWRRTLSVTTDANTVEEQEQLEATELEDLTNSTQQTLFQLFLAILRTGREKLTGQKQKFFEFPDQLCLHFLFATNTVANHPRKIALSWTKGNVNVAPSFFMQLLTV